MKVTFKNEARIQQCILQGKLSEKQVEFVREYIALLRKYGITETLACHKDNDYITTDEPVGDGAINFSIPIPGEDDFEDVFVGDVCDGHVVIYPSDYAPSGIEIWF